MIGDKDDDTNLMEKVGEAYTAIEKSLEDKVSTKEETHEATKKTSTFDPIIIYKTTVEPSGQIFIKSSSHKIP